MFGMDQRPRKLTKDGITFGILFIVISSFLCSFVHFPVLLFFALIFLSGLIAFYVSGTLLRWFDRMLAAIDERRSR
jgi:hypothetical protein